YSLVQTVLIQDLSLHNAQSRITDLETQLTETTRASSAPPSFLGGPSFLGAVFGQGEPSGGVRTSTVPPGGAGTGPPIAATPQAADPLRNTPAPVMIRTSRARTPPPQDKISTAILRVDNDRPPVSGRVPGES